MTALVILFTGALGLAAGRLSPALPSLAAGKSLSSESAVESAALFGLGMRRTAADLGLVRLIIYYGTSQRGEHDHGQPGHVHSAGDHRELAARAIAVLDADPAFTYAALFASGALAFNLQRPEEALEVLEYALARDPRNWKLRSYVAAIGFHKKGDRAAVIAALEPVLAYPDCPAMVKNLMAVLYKREGRLREAAALYTELLSHPDYAAVARQQLDKL